MQIPNASPGGPANTQVRIYSPSQQGSGSFDGGRITEIKPIGFRGDGAEVIRIGPLFYWAWATADGPATIALHPHKGFEIASYLLHGEIGHFDTGGHEGRIRAGGVQVMQTGSGVSHEECTFDGHTEFFQIWFEPNLREALTRPPAYHEYTDDELPVSESAGVLVRSIIGGRSPVQLVVDARMEHWTLAAHAVHRIDVQPGRIRAMVTLAGPVGIQNGAVRSAVQPRDFVVVTGCDRAVFEIAAGETVSEVLAIDIPAEVSYPLLHK